MSTRDRLYLAFADLASYGIVASPRVEGSVAEAVEASLSEAANRAAFARRDFVFWREADERVAFNDEGELVGRLMVYLGNAAIAPAMHEALRRVALSAACEQRDDHRGITLVSTG